MPIREVKDEDHCLWTVWDTYPASSRRLNVVSGYESGWLTFECAGEKRRLHPVPPAWDEAPDGELLAYLARAEVVRREGDDGSGG